MKKLILLAGLFCLLLSVHAASVNAGERAKAHFKATYTGVDNSTWYTAPDNSIYCIFHRGKTVDRVFYDSRGYWQYTMVSYPPSELRLNITRLITDHFEGYHISYINEIQSTYDQPVYMINIEDPGHIKVVRVSDDEIDVKQELIKE